MHSGPVKWFSDQKDLGFIEVQEGSDVFVPHSAINATGFKSLKAGDRVSFEIVEGDRGTAANCDTVV